MRSRRLKSAMIRLAVSVVMANIEAISSRPMCPCPADERDRHCERKLSDPGSPSLCNGYPSLVEDLHVPSSSIGHQWESFGGLFSLPSGLLIRDSSRGKPEHSPA